LEKDYPERIESTCATISYPQDIQTPVFSGLAENLERSNNSLFGEPLARANRSARRRPEACETPTGGMRDACATHTLTA